MYEIKKTLDICGSHNLTLPYASSCVALHGHNWRVTVVVESERLNKEDMVLDFTVIKDVVKTYDHKHVNDLIEGNPTAENMAHDIAERLKEVIDWLDHNPVVVSVTVQETEGNVACFTP